jgi:hypothetical protein
MGIRNLIFAQQPIRKLEVQKMSQMPKNKNSEVKGTPADVEEALKKGIITQEEAERVLEQMRKRDGIKKTCGWCSEEIKNGDYFTVWQKGKLVGMFCKKCWFERKDLDEHIRKMFGQK